MHAHTQKKIKNKFKGLFLLVNFGKFDFCVLTFLEAALSAEGLLYEPGINESM